MKTIKAIIEALFILACTLAVIVCAYFIIGFGTKYQSMEREVIEAEKQVLIFRDSLAGQVKIIREKEAIIKSITKNPPQNQTQTYINKQRKNAKEKSKWKTQIILKLKYYYFLPKVE